MTEQPKAPAPTHEQHPYPPPTHLPFPPPGYNGSPYPPQGPPGAYMPPFFAYPPQPDGSHPEGAQNGAPAPFMIGLPPGVVYAYPPHPQAQHFGAPPANPAPTALSRPKRKQVKMACTNCAGACKRCDESRPCERCVKYGIADTCVDGQRKERKKGIKRGPYRRKNKSESDGPSFNGEWTPNSQSPSTTTTAAAIHAVAQYAPEGYYPVYYPPPGAFMPHPPEGQPGPDASPPHAANGQPIMPYYIHPGGYPPFPHYPPMYPPQAGPPPPGTPNGVPPPVPAPQPVQQQPAPGVPAPPPAEPQQQTVNPAEASGGKPDEAPAAPQSGAVDANGVAAVNGKKRSRTGKNGEPKQKKAKGTAAAKAKGDEAPAAEQPIGNGEDASVVASDKTA